MVAHRLLSRYRAHGLLAAGSAGGTFARIADPPERNELRKELVEDGSLVAVDVEGVRGKRFVLAGEVALLEAPPEPAPSVAFIAPFDSLLWDTTLLASLYGFEFVWEGFFPPAKRRFGYYVLPLLFGDRFGGIALRFARRDLGLTLLLLRGVSFEGCLVFRGLLDLLLGLLFGFLGLLFRGSLGATAAPGAGVGHASVVAIRVGEIGIVGHGRTIPSTVTAGHAVSSQGVR